jgi:hypothetical protein
MQNAYKSINGHKEGKKPQNFKVQYTNIEKNIKRVRDALASLGCYKYMQACPLMFMHSFNNHP